MKNTDPVTPAVGARAHVRLSGRAGAIAVCGEVWRIIGARVGIQDGAGQCRWFLTEQLSPCDCGQTPAPPSKGA